MPMYVKFKNSQGVAPWFVTILSKWSIINLLSFFFIATLTCHQSKAWKGVIISTIMVFHGMRKKFPEMKCQLSYQFHALPLMLCVLWYLKYEPQNQYRQDEMNSRPRHASSQIHPPSFHVLGQKQGLDIKFTHDFSMETKPLLLYIPTGLMTRLIRYDFRPDILMWSSLLSPSPGSSSNSPFRKLAVFSERWTLLQTKKTLSNNSKYGE